MKSLVIDTSSARTTVGLFDGTTLIFEGHHDGATAHAEALPVLVKEALLHFAVIDEVIVGMGPGPFTGLRAGIVFAQTFAHLRDIEWRGVCSLDGIDIDSEDYVVATDARRNEIYWARYQSGSRIDGPNVSTREIVATLHLPIFGFSFTEELYPSPHLLLARSRTSEVDQPMYLRRPDAIPSNERR